MKFTSCQNVDCNKEYDFNDLIDVALQAWKDGYLKVLEFEKGLVEQIFTVIGDDAYRWHHGDDEYDQEIWLIKSLYTETFVIDDIRFPELKVGGKFVQNGIEWVLDEDRIERIINTPFFLLKGAIVTQKRSLNE